MIRKLFVFFLIVILLLHTVFVGFAAEQRDAPSPRTADGAADPLHYTEVYEPETSWAMAATVAWRADGTALSVAKQQVRPATAYVWLDADLTVYDRDGALICRDLSDYIGQTAAGMIPAFYLSDDETARALRIWLEENGLRDCFAVSDPDHWQLVAEVADLVHVRGLLDYSAIPADMLPDLSQIVSTVHRAHGKVVLLDAQAADRDMIRRLQSLELSVWVRTETDTRSIVTAYTNGVNGVLADDYAAALRAQELFQDDEPSLLRLPQIIGHRGDPSSFVENTIDSARGAYEEGVSAAELDLQLSKDGELFVWHDEDLRRFFCLEEPALAEELTLEELQALSFDWEDPECGILAANIVPADHSRYGTLYGQEDRKSYTVPTFRDYLETFRNTDCILNTEIKSSNPEILSAMNELVEEFNFRDRFTCITFNRDILDTLYQQYPEIPAGVLGYAVNGLPKPGMVELQDYEAITRSDGAEAALDALCGVLDQWNAAYHPAYMNYGTEMVRAGRHRGLTVWPWVYSSDEAFARDYLNGVSGMTLNYPWIASDFLVSISSEDVTLRSVSELQKPVGTARTGSHRTLDRAELVKLEILSENEALMIWRYRAELKIRGKSYGFCYLYSNPFTVCAEDVNRFSDVPADAYYAQSVLWAVKNGVTAGTASDTFSPELVCTRAQAVTFLWRAFGCPEPDEKNCGFTDVSATAYYYKAVLWASERGITTGTDENLFSPGGQCTRAQIVTFLYRALGQAPSGSAELPFQDTAPGAYYYDAVAWALEAGITDGTTETTFSPMDPCTRCQVVTFLFRACKD